MSDRGEAVLVEFAGMLWTPGEMRRVCSLLADVLLEVPEVRDALRGYLLDEGREPTREEMRRALDDRDALLFLWEARGGGALPL